MSMILPNLTKIQVNLIIVDESQEKSATSAVGRALVGGVLLGGAGLIAGLSAKNKKYVYHRNHL